MDKLHFLDAVETPWGEPVDLAWHEIAPLILTSGAIIAGDPFDLLTNDQPAFAPQVAPGRYPVRLIVGYFPNPADTMTHALVTDLRVTLAVLCLNTDEPVRWEKAAPASVNKLQEDEIWCYTTDSGCGAFLDAATLPMLQQRYRQQSGFPDLLADILAAHSRPTYTWADILLEATSCSNLTIFSAYGGNGEYGSYWGYDAKDQPVCLVTDFDVLDTEAWQKLAGQWPTLLATHAIEK